MTEIIAGSVFIIGLVILLTVGLLAARRRLVPQGAVTVTVNDSTKIETKRGETLLSVLHGAGIGIPAGCGGSGTCGLCRVTATGEGAGEAQATEKGILSAAERRAKVRLACQVTLRGPANVTVPSEILTAESMDCAVLSNRMLAPLIRELVLDLPPGVPWDFRAGGFGQLTAPAYDLDFSTIEVPETFRETWRIAGWNRLKGSSVKPVADAHAVTEALLAISVDSRADVDDFVAKALAKGASEYAEPRDLGFMYQRGIADLDGHQWEVFFMDESQMPTQ